VTRAEPWPARPTADRDAPASTRSVSAARTGTLPWRSTWSRITRRSMASLASRAKAPRQPSEERPMPDTLLVAAGGTPEELAASIRGLRFPSAGRRARGPWRLAFVAHSKGDFAAKLDLITKHFRPGAVRHPRRPGPSTPPTRRRPSADRWPRSPRAGPAVRRHAARPARGVRRRSRHDRRGRRGAPRRAGRAVRNGSCSPPAALRRSGRPSSNRSSSGATCCSRCS